MITLPERKATMRQNLLRSFAAMAVVAVGGLVQTEALAEAPVVVGGRVQILKIYPIPGGNAVGLSKTLQDQYGATALIIPGGNNSIIVYASPEDHARIVGPRCGRPEKNIKAESVDAGAH